MKEDVDEIFEEMDSNNNGYIEYEEFVRAAIDKTIFLTDNFLKFAFKYFDKDGSGEISYNEIAEIFGDSIAKGDVKESLKAIINQVDINGDGKISANEFSAAVGKLFTKDDDKNDF